MKERRKVRVVKIGDTFVVEYISRRPRQRYWAGSFYAPDTTKEKVKQWVRRQPNIEL